MTTHEHILFNTLDYLTKQLEEVTKRLESLVKENEDIRTENRNLVTMIESMVSRDHTMIENLKKAPTLKSWELSYNAFGQPYTLKPPYTTTYINPAYYSTYPDPPGPADPPGPGR